MLSGTDLGHAVMIGDFDPVAREHSHNKVPVFKVRHACIVAQACINCVRMDEKLIAINHQ